MKIIDTIVKELETRRDNYPATGNKVQRLIRGAYVDAILVVKNANVEDLAEMCKVCGHLTGPSRHSGCDSKDVRCPWNKTK